jgi:hypothetical protein
LLLLLQEDAKKPGEAERVLTVEEKEEQRAMAYTLEAEEATRMVRNRYGGALLSFRAESNRIEWRHAPVSL